MSIQPGKKPTPDEINLHNAVFNGDFGNDNFENPRDQLVAGAAGIAIPVIAIAGVYAVAQSGVVGALGGIGAAVVRVVQPIIIRNAPLINKALEETSSSLMQADLKGAVFGAMRAVEGPVSREVVAAVASLEMGSLTQEIVNEVRARQVLERQKQEEQTRKTRNWWSGIDHNAEWKKQEDRRRESWNRISEQVDRERRYQEDQRRREVDRKRGEAQRIVRDLEKFISDVKSSSYAQKYLGIKFALPFLPNALIGAGIAVSEYCSGLSSLVREATEALSLLGFEQGKANGIGGIGNNVGIIEGLLNKHRNVIEFEHLFYIPSIDGNHPFKNEELQQILRELIVGIYAFDTMPCFSLHFNSEANLYPVIYPVYQNTLVGRVMGLLDYYMKGFLNGGYFNEQFIQSWQTTRTNDPKVLRANLIDLHDLCQKELGRPYYSIQELLDLFETEEGVQPGGSDRFSDFSGFRSSFRIIAKQNSIRQSENLFTLDGGFDVEYSIEPDPTYAEELRKYRSEFGDDPPGYKRLERAYKEMKRQIEKIMPRLSGFRDLFEMLKVINFFCYYLNTLKQSHKIPLLEAKTMDASLGCPSLFPSLPIRRMKRKEVNIHWAAVFKGLNASGKEMLNSYLKNPNEDLPSEDLVEALLNALSNYLQKPVHLHFNIVITLIQLKKLKEERIGEYQNQVEQFRKKRQTIVDRKTIEAIGQRIASLERRSNAELENGDAFLSLLEDFEDDAFVELTPVLSLYSEVPDDEKRKNKRVVGGCGLDLTNQSVTDDPVGLSILNESFAILPRVGDEVFAPVKLNSKDAADGHIFRLHCIDFPGNSHKDYKWTQFLFQEESLATSVKKWAAFSSVYNDDHAVFEAGLATDEIELNVKDCHGVFLAHYAASSVEDRYLKKLIDNKTPLDVEDPLGFTPLHYAARNGSIKNMNLLLGQCANLRDKSAKNNATPLYMAAQNGQLAAVQELIRQGANVNAQVVHGMTALYCAIHHGHDDVVLELLKHSIDVNLALEDGTTPLYRAVEKGNELIVKRLLEKGADPKLCKIDGYAPLHCAAKGGKESMLRALFQHPSVVAAINEPLKSGQTALHLAAMYNGSLAVDILLKNEANPTLFGWDGATPLFVAIMRGNTLAAECLIEHSLGRTTIDTKNIKGQTPLKAALEGRYYGVVERLLKYNAKTPDDPLEFVLDLCKARVDPLLIKTYCTKLTEEQKKKALAVAAQYGHNQMVSHFFLIDKVPDFREGVNWGVAHFAAKFDHVNVIQKFLEDKKQLTDTDRDGNTLAAIAAEYGSLRVLKVLLDAMIARDIPFNNQAKGCHLLTAAIEAGEIESADAIIHKISDTLDIPLDQLGRHATHVAAKNGDVEMLELLRSRGFSFEAKDKKGNTAFHYAFDYDWQDTIDYFFDEKKELHIPNDILAFAADRKKGKLLENRKKERLVKENDIVNFEDDNGVTLLFSNIQDKDIVKLRLDQGANPNHMSDGRMSPLYHAVLKDASVQILQLLLQHGAKIDQPCGKYKATCLHRAVEKESFELTQFLVSEDADVNKPNLLGMTPIHFAAMKGNLSLVRMLWMAGASLQAIDHGGKTVAHYAAEAENPALVVALKEWGVSLNKQTKIRVPSLRKSIAQLQEQEEGAAPLHVAARKGNLVMLKTFVGQGCNLELMNKRGQGVLFYAALGGNKETVKYFEDFRLMQDQRIEAIWGAIQRDSVAQIKRFYENENANLYLDSYGSTGLHRSAMVGALSCAHFLLKKGANPNLKASGDTPLSIAIKNKQLVLARDLAQVTQDFDVNDSTQNYLHAACAENDVEMGSFLIELRIKVDNPDPHGKTALFYAVKKGNYAFAHLLLACGARCDQKITEHSKGSLRQLIKLYQKESKDGETRLHLAARCGDERHLPLLSKLDSIESQNKEGESPLHLAVRMKNVSIVRQILQLSSGLMEQEDHFGRTPLFVAANEGVSLDIMKFLLNARANPCVDNKDLETALCALSQRTYNATTSLLFQLLHQHLPKDPIEHPSEMMVAAIQCQDLKLFYQCINQGHPVENTHFSLIHLAINLRSTAIAQHLALWFIVDVNRTDENGQTPVSLAMKSGQRQLAAFFILQGAEVEPYLKVQIVALSKLEHDIQQKTTAFENHWRKRLIEQIELKKLPTSLLNSLVQPPAPTSNLLRTRRIVTRQTSSTSRCIETDQ